MAPSCRFREPVGPDYGNPPDSPARCAIHTLGPGAIASSRLYGSGHGETGDNV
jgi:hypothetical protein